MSNEPTRTASSATMPPSEITATSVVPPPMSTTMFPSGSWIGRPAPIAAAMGCSMQVGRAAARRAGGLEHGPLLDVGDRRRHADEHAAARRSARRPARWNSSRIMRWVISKSVIAPPRSGRTATM